MELNKRSILGAAILVASMGYFVDIYDLLLFAVIRIPSLKSLGLSMHEVNSTGLLLLNVQMVGMLIGGIFWGILGDKRGRLSVLFGSIIIYSLANIANGLVHGTTGYLIWRFAAGFGLAGELGAGITLVAEILPRDKRGYGTLIIASVGVFGAVMAGFVANLFGWRTCYFIGGGLGLVLLLLRIGVAESGMFASLKRGAVSRGNFFMLFNDRRRFARYLKCLLLGMPAWYLTGILVSFSNVFAQKMHVQGTISPAKAIMYCYAGLTAGDLISGLISQWWKSRKKVMILFLLISSLGVLTYFRMYGANQVLFYGICLALGFGAGFWTIFVTIAAESFGTNLRATVATTAPNFARGMLPLITLLFTGLMHWFSYLQSGWITGIVCIGLSLAAALTIEETFSKNLDYIEQ